MARITNKKKVDKIKQAWQYAAQSERRKWQTVQQKAYDFSMGDQLTKDQKDKLEEAGMPTFVVNRISPIIRMTKFFITANNPRWQAVGVEGSDVDIGAVHSDLSAYCWSLSGGKSLMSQVVDDSLRKSLGLFHIDVDPDSDRGMGDVIFKTIDPFDLYVDPMSRDFLFRDAAYMIIKKDLPRGYLLHQFPDHSRKIKAASGNPEFYSATQRDPDSSDMLLHSDLTRVAYTSEGEEDDLLDYYEKYEKEKVPFYNLFIRDTLTAQEVEAIDKEVQEAVDMMAKEVYVSLEEQKNALDTAVRQGSIIEERAKLELEKAQRQAQDMIDERTEAISSEIMEKASKISNYFVSEDEYKALEANPDAGIEIINAVRYHDTRIKVSVVVGDKFLYESYIEGATHYPIVPIPYIHTGTPFPMSLSSSLVGKQEELNKAHQLIIHNANLGSNLRWMYQEGSIPEDEWESYSSAPGAKLKYRQGFDPPTPVMPLPVNQAFTGIVESGKFDMEYLSGMPRTLMGDASSQHDTYRGMLAMDEYGTRTVKEWVSNVFEPALSHLGNVFKEIAQATYTAHKVFRVVQPGAGREEDERYVEINKMMYDDYGNAVGMFNDYASARFDVRSVGGSTVPVNRWALIDEYFRWFQAGAIDDIAFLQETDIRDKEKIAQRKSVYAQMKQQIDQYEEAIKDRDGTIETLTRQVIQAGIKDRVREADMGIKESKVQTVAEQKHLQKEMRREAAFAKKDLNTARKK